tara:strand:+ start:4693 stop:5751 length:1059 start_codon:yes stop_codon:yes gene_type:complete
MADIRSKAVLTELAPLYQEANYGVDLAATSLREPLGMGDSIGVPSIGSLTVNASGATDANPEAVTNAELTLNANLEPWINAKLPQIESMALGGQWASQTAAQCVSQLKNSMDSDFLKYLIARNWTAGTASTYHVNPGAESLTSDMVYQAIATLTNNKGVTEQDCVFMVSAWGRGSLSSIAGFVPNMTDAGGRVNGLPAVGSLMGIPVYQTSAVPNARTIASTAWTDDGSSAMTITVGADHGVVKGQKITFDTVTGANDIASAAEVTSTAATTITVASVASGSATEAGTITVEASENLLINKNQTFVAQQIMPKTRIVDLYNSTGSALQVSAVWGRIARAGHAIVLGSPKSAI